MKEDKKEEEEELVRVVNINHPIHEIYKKNLKEEVIGTLH